MNLLFDESQISYYAARYNAINPGYDTPIENLVTEVKGRGYLNKSDLIDLSKWMRTGRNMHRIEKNSNDSVEEKTRSALMSTTERDSIGHLRCLSGIGWATGSAILHWFHKDPYPFWNEPALDAVQFARSHYSNALERWEAYVLFCRGIAERNNVDMRTLDRALWQFSNDH